MEKQKHNRSKLGRALLVGSLAFNLLILGAVVGIGLRGGPSHSVLRGADIGVTPMTRAFTPEQRGELRAGLQGQIVKRSNADRADKRRLTQEALAILRAEEFDRAAFEALIEEQLQMTRQRMQHGQVAILDTIQAMNADERAAFADRYEEQLRKPRKEGAGRPPRQP